MEVAVLGSRGCDCRYVLTKPRCPVIVFINDDDD